MAEPHELVQHELCLRHEPGQPEDSQIFADAAAVGQSAAARCGTRWASRPGRACSTSSRAPMVGCAPPAGARPPAVAALCARPVEAKEPWRRYGSTRMRVRRSARQGLTAARPHALPETPRASRTKQALQAAQPPRRGAGLAPRLVRISRLRAEDEGDARRARVPEARRAHAGVLTAANVGGAVAAGRGGGWEHSRRSVLSPAALKSCAPSTCIRASRRCRRLSRWHCGTSVRWAPLWRGKCKR